MAKCKHCNQFIRTGNPLTHDEFVREFGMVEPAVEPEPADARLDELRDQRDRAEAAAAAAAEVRTRAWRVLVEARDRLRDEQARHSRTQMNASSPQPEPPALVAARQAVAGALANHREATAWASELLAAASDLAIAYGNRRSRRTRRSVGRACWSGWGWRRPVVGRRRRSCANEIPGGDGNPADVQGAVGGRPEGRLASDNPPGTPSMSALRTIAELAAPHGMAPGTMRCRLQAAGLRPEPGTKPARYSVAAIPPALFEPAQERAPRAKLKRRPVPATMMTFPTLAELAAAHGMRPGTLRERLHAAGVRPVWAVAPFRYDPATIPDAVFVTSGPQGSGLPPEVEAELVGIIEAEWREAARLEALRARRRADDGEAYFELARRWGVAA